MDTLLLGGTIYTHAGARPAEALLVRDGRVAAVGSEAAVRAAARAGAVVERVSGLVVTPGLTDAHVHLTAWALLLRRVDVRGAASEAEAAERVARFAAAHPEGWIRGQGWSPQALGGLPTREALDRAAPGRAVVLESQDIHSVWLSSEALRRCGIDAGTADPPGGRVVRDPATGEPTGVLQEHACALALRHLPDPELAEVREALADAQTRLHAWGITGVHSVEPTGRRDWALLREAGLLRLRVLQSVPLHGLEEAIALGLCSGQGDAWVRTGGVKMFLDGALGSRTAWMREPYEPAPGAPDTDRGISTLPEPEFRAAASRAAAAGIACTVHAIGDAAVDLALRVLAETPRPGAMAHRIEHLQLCPPEWWDRAARAGLVASVQPVHLRTDVEPAERHWGHRRSRGAYAFGALLRAGTTLAFGSDVPVETPDPRQGLYAAVARRAWDGGPPGGWFAEHALSAAEALACYTEGPARAAGEADHRGRLLPGYDADLAVWNRDPLRCAPEELLEMRCRGTMVAGEWVHRAE